MFSKMVIFTICVLGVFALLMSTMPAAFLSQTYNPTYRDPVVAAYYDMYNITCYSSAEKFNITFGGQEQFEEGMPDGQAIEYNWYYVGAWEAGFDIRHLDNKFFYWWIGWHKLTFDIDKDYVNGYDLIDRWDGAKSYFEAECDHLRVNIIFLPYNDTWTIEESWSEGNLTILTSYEIDWNATHINAWTILTQLLTFQSPNLGIGGIFGTILNVIIALPLWTIIAISVLKVVQSLIPFIRGVDD